MLRNAYFCATKRGSKKSVVILCAYMEHAIMQQMPMERNKQIYAPNKGTKVTSFKFIFIRQNERNLPLRMKWKPDRTVRRDLVVSEPPILVHFIPTKARMAPKKPRHTDAIISPRHT